MFKLISIDPGKSKCGLVLAELSEKKVDKAIIIKSELLEDYVRNLNTIENISKIVVGNGTTSRKVRENYFFKKEIITFEEKILLLEPKKDIELFPIGFCLVPRAFFLLGCHSNNFGRLL